LLSAIRRQPYAELHTLIRVGNSDSIPDNVIGNSSRLTRTSRLLKRDKNSYSITRNPKKRHFCDLIRLLSPKQENNRVDYRQQVSEWFSC
jgi:hypothetical protein